MRVIFHDVGFSRFLERILMQGTAHLCLCLKCPSQIVIYSSKAPTSRPSHAFVVHAGPTSSGWGIVSRSSRTSTRFFDECGSLLLSYTGENRGEEGRRLRGHSIPGYGRFCRYETLGDDSKTTPGSRSETAKLLYEFQSVCGDDTTWGDGITDWRWREGGGVFR